MLSSIRDAALANPARTLGTARLLIAVSGYASPTLTWGAAGMGKPDGPSSEVMTRMFAARELALAAGAFSSDPVVRDATLKIGVAVDSLDALAYAAALKNGAPKASTLSALLALGAIGLGLAALSQD